MPSGDADLGTLTRPAQRRADTASHLHIGFVALTDAAPLLVARALGFFADAGLAVTLNGESSWAALRDRVAFGALDAAHMLNPMPIAAALGLGTPRHDLVVASGLALNGNTLVLSHALAEEAGAPLTPEGFATAARRRAAAGHPPRIAVVFAHSSHNYLLRHWMAGAGLDPDRDLHLTVVPPPAMAAALAAGQIDGLCAGEPWGSDAIARGLGRLALSTGAIWPDHPEKVFAFAERTVKRSPDLAVAATAAVIRAARWLDDPANRDAAARLLHEDAFPTVPVPVIAEAFAGRVAAAPGDEPIALATPLRFRRASRPDPRRAAWWLSAMRRWGHLPAIADVEAALAPWRNTIWQEAAALVGEPPPPFFPPAPDHRPETDA